MTPVNYTGGLYSADLFLRARHARDRAVAGLQGRRPDRHHLRRGASRPSPTPATASPTPRIVAPDAATSVQDDSAGETLFGFGCTTSPPARTRRWQKNAAGEELYPGPGDNAFLDRPERLRRPDGPRPARRHLSAGRWQLRPGRPHRRGCNRGDRAARRSPTTRSSPPTPDARSAASASPTGAFVGQVTDTPTTATAPSQSGGFVDTGSFTLVNAAREPLSTTAAVSGIVLGARTRRERPAV